ncbi:MAG TPA: hypothetical protein DHW82_12665 [Spirochaetia bacterium]|nr:MAG: hypothetical protein A2Y41_06135 [Spirochaetes bacterium GWB1_36_13]HCL57842.1 hypothetical protein [Spirochaetia bacterium]
MAKISQKTMDKIIQGMKESAFSYDDFWEEYYHGVNTVYFYNSEKKSFCVRKIDIIAASFMDELDMTEAQMRDKLNDFTEADFIEQGFIL